MEAAVSGRAAGGIVRPPCGASAAGPDGEARGANSGRDASETDRRVDPLEHAAAGEETWTQSHARRARVAKARDSAPPDGALHGVGRPRLRAESGRRLGVVLASAPARRRLLRR